MRPGGGKAKGSAYERRIAKILTSVFYPDNDGIFQRIYSHPIPKKGEVRGDLVSMRRYVVKADPVSPEESLVIDKSFPFTVECKDYKGIKPLFSGLYSKECEIFDWLWQAHEVAVQNKKMPLVVFKIYRGEDLAAIWNRDYVEMTRWFGPFQESSYLVQNDKLMVHEGIRIFKLTTFLAWPDWGIYKVGATEYIKSIMPKGEA